MKFGDKDSSTAVFTWKSRLQPTVSHSTLHAEYMAASNCGVEIHDLRLFLAECGVIFTDSDQTTRYSTLYTDSKNAMCISKDQYQHHKVKSIHSRYHIIREYVKGSHKIFNLKYVKGNENPADLFTKILPRPSFERYRDFLMNITRREGKDPYGHYNE